MFRTVRLGSVPAQPISGQGQWAVAQAAPDVNGVFTLVRRYRTRAAAARAAAVFADPHMRTIQR
jgi:hypothetical protein